MRAALVAAAAAAAAASVASGGGQGPGAAPAAAPGTATAAAPTAVAFLVDATAPTGPTNPLLAACHADLGYVHASWAFYSQMIMGPAFDSQSKWNPYTASPGDKLQWAVDSSTPYLGVPAMRVALAAGAGPAGLTNRGMGNEGLAFRAPPGGAAFYEGWLLARADGAAAVAVTVALRDYTSNATLAEASLTLPGNPAGAAGPWTNLTFTLTPSAGTACVGIAPGSDPAIDCGDVWPSPGHVCVRCGGEFFFGVSASPSAPTPSIHVAYVYLQPGPWARFAGLPVKAEAVATLAAMGVTGVRVGGTYAQGIIWKDWRGPAWERPTRNFFAGAGNLLVFSPFDMLDLGAAAGLEVIITMSRNQSAQDVADLVEYAYGNASTPWGAVRTYNDSHPAPYAALRGIELGNEQPNDDWVAQVTAMEAAAAAAGLVPSPFFYLYPENELHGGDIAALVAAGVPPERFMADAHGGWGGMIEDIQADFKAAGNVSVSGISCETNGLYNVFGRALEEAVDLITYDTAPPDVYARVVLRAISFCNERSGHMTRYDQGASFWLPNMTWLQPPGWVHAMNAPARGAVVLPVSPPPPNPFAARGAAAAAAAAAGGSQPMMPSSVTYSASASADGTTVFVRIANTLNATAAVNVTIRGVAVGACAGAVLSAGGDLNATNTPADPTAVAPAPLPMGPCDGPVTVPPLAYAVLNFTGTPTAGAAAAVAAAAAAAGGAAGGGRQWGVSG
jgi:hypothetical protein